MTEAKADAADAAEALRVLDDEERPEPERIAAARQLASCGTIRQIAPMLSVLERAEAGLGLEITDALRTLGAGAVLARDLKHGTDERRERAAIALVRLKDPSTLPALREALRDPVEKVRQQVCQGLARLEGPEPARLLVRALSDPSSDVRCLAADALWRRGAHEAEPDLRAALAGETDDLARDYFEEALRRLGKS